MSNSFYMVNCINYIIYFCELNFIIVLQAKFAFLVNLRNKIIHKYHTLSWPYFNLPSEWLFFISQIITFEQFAAQAYLLVNLELSNRQFIQFKQLNSMCYQENKGRYFVKNKPKTFQNNQPLIKDKKFSQIREKENEKHNVEYHNKSKNLSNNEINTTMEFQTGKFHSNCVTIPSSYMLAEKQNYYANERNGGYQHNPATVPQNYTKNLTFGHVRSTGLKVKEANNLGQQANFISILETKKVPQTIKNNNYMEKDKSNPLERYQKPLIQRVADKKEKPQKQALVTRPVASNEVDDFACTEELDFKPIEKKSIVPEKKHAIKFDFTKSKKVEKKNEGKDLKQFQFLEKVINSNSQAELLQNFCQRQEQYLVNPGYIEKNQKHMNWLSRAIVIDWMRQLSYQFRLQRNTFHIAVVLFDNYLERTSNVPKSFLQAIGATNLFIASKLEEFQCKQSQQFAYSTNNSCSVQDIHEMEIKITKSLRFRLNPPTFYDLANKIMSQWDGYIIQNQYASSHPLFDMSSKIFFKQLDENSYKLFKQLMQLIDCSVYDIQTTQYKPRMVVCAFMYLIIGKQLKIYNVKQITTEFPGSSLYLLDEGNELNNLFRAFVEQIFGFTLFDILPVVQYAATFFDLRIMEEKPIINENEDLEVMSLQEYCSYQTYNSNMIRAVKTRNRGLY